VILFTVLIYFTNSIFAQVDTVSVVRHSPKRATLRALVPGLGQIYNKKYWKLPIVYSGFAVIGYFAVTNRSEYLKYNEAYVCNLNSEENSLITNYDNNQEAYVCSVDEYKCSEIARKYSTEQLKSASDYYRRNMELSYIVLVAWYGLQILDANVDAHLYYWEVNDKLSLKVEPTIQQIPVLTQQIIPGNGINHNGLRITVSF